jgi:hypothetical protein
VVRSTAVLLRQARCGRAEYFSVFVREVLQQSYPNGARTGKISSKDYYPDNQAFIRTCLRLRKLQY